MQSMLKIQPLIWADFYSMEKTLTLRKISNLLVISNFQ